MARTAMTTFRLEPGVLEQMDRIADALAASDPLRCKVTRADVVRLGVRVLSAQLLGTCGERPAQPQPKKSRKSADSI